MWPTCMVLGTLSERESEFVHKHIDRSFAREL